MRADAVHWGQIEGPPESLDDECSRHFTWRKLIQCGATFEQLCREGVEVPGPQQLGTWQMLAGLAQAVLDPVVDHFGVLVKLTYGFAPPALTKHVKRVNVGRDCPIAPQLDQHAGMELNQRGHKVSPRGGAAVDVRLGARTSAELLVWLLANVEYDRIYYYGPKRAVHVSWAPTRQGQCWEMVKSPSGRWLPRAYSPGEGKR